MIGRRRRGLKTGWTGVGLLVPVEVARRPLARTTGGRAPASPGGTRGCPAGRPRPRRAAPRADARATPRPGPRGAIVVLVEPRVGCGGSRGLRLVHGLGVERLALVTGCAATGSSGGSGSATADPRRLGLGGVHELGAWLLAEHLRAPGAPPHRDRPRGGAPAPGALGWRRRAIPCSPEPATPRGRTVTVRGLREVADARTVRFLPDGFARRARRPLRPPARPCRWRRRPPGRRRRTTP